ncbi:MAG: GNAT family N-acetyltransferase [Candidatus Heimdallarchaeaceae archaeon]
MNEFKFEGSPYIGEKVKLRALEKSDVPKIMQYWNTYETRKFLGNPIPMSSMMEEEWITSVHQRAKSKSAFIFAITNRETDEFLGSGGLESIDWINRNAVLGIAIHNPANHNKGYGTDAMKCLLAFGFRILNLNRIELLVFEYNPRAIHVYEKIGFKQVGCKRKDSFHEGKYYDTIIMDILAEEYLDLYMKS